MFPLTNNLTLDRLENINDLSRRIIVSDTEEIFTGDIDDPSVSQGQTTLYQTNNIDTFLSYRLPSHFKQWQAMGDVTIYCDETYYVKIMVYWLRHLFPQLTLAALQEIYFIDGLERDFRDPQFNWEDQDDMQALLKHQFQSGPALHPKLKKAIIEFWEELPFCVRDMAALNNVPMNIASELRERLRTCIHGIVRSTDQRIRFLYYTPQLASMVGETALENTHDSLYAFMDELRLSVRGDDLEAALQDDTQRQTVMAEFEADQQRLHASDVCCAHPERSVRELMIPFQLLSLSDEDLIQQYYDKLTQVDRLTVLIPSRLMSIFSVNLLMWSLKRHRLGHNVLQPFNPTQE